MTEELNAAEQKYLAAQAAVASVENGMVLGLGTGSTVEFALQLIAEKVKSGLRISGVPTSIRTAKLANKLGIPLLDNPAEVIKIDLTIDGADEADEECNLIKGGGGALTREKIVASISAIVIIMVDQSKIKQALGSFPVPVEVLPFGWRAAGEAIKELGAASVSLREKNNASFVTDNQNWILDCSFVEITNPEDLTHTINAIPAVVENGIFFGLCDRLVIGQTDNTVRTLNA